MCRTRYQKPLFAKLLLKLVMQRSIAHERTPPENLDAWGAYQQGLALEPSGDSADYAAAIAHFDRAITYDPSFVDALAMATLQRARLVLFYNPTDSKQILSHSERLIRSALRLDPKSAVARCARGRLFYAQGEFEPGSIKL